MIEEMKLWNFSGRTQKTYVSAMIGVAKYYRRSPDQPTQDDIRCYLLHLEKRGLSPSSRNVTISGMKFFYHQCLGWNEKQLFIPPRKRTWQLPEVLRQKEVERLLLAAQDALFAGVCLPAEISCSKTSSVSLHARENIPTELFLSPYSYRSPQSCLTLPHPRAFKFPESKITCGSAFSPTSFYPPPSMRRPFSST
jgi:hypothetical protein